ncbi:MAG TPA: nitroreductase family protein [Actinomycetota bacterium]|nr:nitroreductase family protein [Actinomycetota bacterium]
MEFREVLRRRRMWRTFREDPVDPAVLDRVLWAGLRAPSAGFTQGYAFLVLEGREQTERFWRAVGEGPGAPSEGTRRAPVLVVPFASKRAYLDRYAEPDKGWMDRDESRWPVPYWLVDTAFASMLVLLAAVDEGLGALFFGLYPPAVPALRAAFGVPEEWTPIGAIALGHRAPDPVVGSARTRPRKPVHEMVHRGRW